MREDGDRRLLFRGWSRLCLHAASLNAAEAASASSTAAARAARAEAMDKQAAVAEEKAEARERAAAKARERASQELSGMAALVKDVGDRAEQSERTIRELNTRQGLWLVRSGMFSSIPGNVSSFYVELSSLKYLSI